MQKRENGGKWKTSGKRRFGVTMKGVIIYGNSMTHPLIPSQEGNPPR
jgi:hypothetical protein